MTLELHVSTCELELPVDFFPVLVLAMYLDEREDVLSLLVPEAARALLRRARARRLLRWWRWSPPSGADR